MRKLSVSLTVLTTVLSAWAVLDRSTASADDPVTLKIATIAPEGTPWEKQLKQLKQRYEAESGGRIRVKLFFGGSLGGEKALVRRCAQGTIQMAGVSTGAAASLIPELNTLELPYLFRDAAEADRLLDEVVKPRMAKLLADKGFIFGLWAENGFRSFFTKGHAIKSAADLRGLRMRSQESIPHLNMYTAFGASPQPIDATNVLTSLQTGVVDGFDNTPIFAFATSWYQAAQHVTLSEHIYQPGLILISKQWYDSLPADLQRVVADVPAEFVQQGRQGVRSLEPLLVKNLAKAGLTVHRLDAAQRAEFERVARTSWEGTLAKSGRGARALLKAIEAARRH
ncbi:MAG: TRAP transporter substrate-binding protein [Deltaproteobacteria bacterium]|nr:TRAP transporter substrate-binding protein [Deltaproteobacteria bacterium]